MAQGGDKKPTAEEKGKGKAASTDTNGIDAVQGVDDEKKELPSKNLKDGETTEQGEEREGHCPDVG